LDLYLHIGTEKTGTTAIQRFMADNRARLRDAGVLYPETLGDGSQKALTVLGQDKDVSRSLWRLVGISSAAELDTLENNVRAGLELEMRAGFSKIVLSSEHCSSRLREESEVGRLRDFLEPIFDRIRIVVYLRRQDDFLLSSYSTSVKTGHTHLLSLPGPKGMHRRYDFDALLSRWAKSFGRENIICRKYERASLVGGDILDDFMDATGIDAGGGYRKPPNLNESLDADALEFLRLLNSHLDGETRRRPIVTALAEISKGPLLDLPEEELAGFMAECASTNLKVAIDYFGGASETSDDPLFQPRSDPRPRRIYEPLSPQRAIEIAGLLWSDIFAKKGGSGGKPEKGKRRGLRRRPGGRKGEEEANPLAA
jgi:hypothetical protein